MPLASFTLAGRRAITKRIWSIGEDDPVLAMVPKKERQLVLSTATAFKTAFNQRTDKAEQLMRAFEKRFLALLAVTEVIVNLHLMNQCSFPLFTTENHTQVTDTLLLKLSSLTKIEDGVSFTSARKVTEHIKIKDVFEYQSLFNNFSYTNTDSGLSSTTANRPAVKKLKRSSSTASQNLELAALAPQSVPCPSTLSVVCDSPPISPSFLSPSQSGARSSGGHLDSCAHDQSVDNQPSPSELSNLPDEEPSSPASSKDSLSTMASVRRAGPRSKKLEWRRNRSRSASSSSLPALPPKKRWMQAYPQADQSASACGDSHLSTTARNMPRRKAKTRALQRFSLINAYERSATVVTGADKPGSVPLSFSKTNNQPTEDDKGAPSEDDSDVPTKNYNDVPAEVDHDAPAEDNNDGPERSATGVAVNPATSIHSTATGSPEKDNCETDSITSSLDQQLNQDMPLHTEGSSQPAGDAPEPPVNVFEPSEVAPDTFIFPSSSSAILTHYETGDGYALLHTCSGNQIPPLVDSPTDTSSSFLTSSSTNVRFSLWKTALFVKYGHVCRMVSSNLSLFTFGNVRIFHKIILVKVKSSHIPDPEWLPLLLLQLRCRAPFSSQSLAIFLEKTLAALREDTGFTPYDSCVSKAPDDLLVTFTQLK